jgi:predicted permease
MSSLTIALRSLRKSPGFTTVAILTLAIGIGANTSVFTFVNAILFRSVPVPHADELVWVAATREPGPRRHVVSFNRNFSVPEFREYRDRLTSLMAIAAYRTIPLALGSGGEPQRVNGIIASSGYFDVLGLRPAAGRFFVPADDAPGATPATVISHALWQRRFGGARDLIGRSVTINGRPFVVLGVAPAAFAGVEIGWPAAMWVPLAAAGIAMPDDAPLLERRDVGVLRAMGRVRSGTTIAQADAQARAIAAQLAPWFPSSNEPYGVRVVPLAGGLDPANQREARPVLGLLMVVPALVLLIACANVANLMLARAVARRREISIRLALGASRGRLVRQLLTEALLLTLAAGAVAMVLVFWLNDVLLAVSRLPPQLGAALAPDLRVLAFTGAVAVITGVAFGLLPAWRASRPDVVPALKDESGGLGRHVRRSRLVAAFVVAQVAMSLVLLATAGLFLRTLGKALNVDPGVETRHGVALSFDLRMQGYDEARQGVFYASLLNRVRGLPGVTAASLSSPQPLGDRMINTTVVAEGWPQDASSIQTGYAAIWPGYFTAVGTPLLRGRDFTTQDVRGAPPVVIVNETLARRLWPDQDPIGERLRLTWGDEPFLEVIGVARDAKYHELTERPRGFLYVPERQQTGVYLSDVTLVVRSAGDPALLLPALAAAIHALDRTLPLFDIVTLEDALRERLAQERGASAVLSVFGVLAVLLASLGLYGVMAYAVTQRTREIGVRLALGAASPQVLRQFVGEGVRLALVGIVVGLLLAAAVTRVVSRFLYGIAATDVVTFAVTAGLLTAVAAAASFLPARRAASVDPMVALRYD